TFESWIRCLKSFPDVKFVTASEAAELYRDTAKGRRFQHHELHDIAEAVGDQVNYQQRRAYALSAAAIFLLLGSVALLDGLVDLPSGAASVRRDVWVTQAPDVIYGPSEPGPALATPITVDWSQYSRTVRWSLEYLAHHHRIPSTVWLGSKGVPPEAFFTSLARVALEVLDGHRPESVEIRPAKFTVGARVADDSPKIFGWLFPEGFH